MGQINFMDTCPTCGFEFDCRSEQATGGFCSRMCENNYDPHFCEKCAEEYMGDQYAECPRCGEPH